MFDATNTAHASPIIINDYKASRLSRLPIQRANAAVIPSKEGEEAVAFVSVLNGGKAVKGGGWEAEYETWSRGLVFTGRLFDVSVCDGKGVYR